MCIQNCHQGEQRRGRESWYRVPGHMVLRCMLQEASACLESRLREESLLYIPKEMQEQSSPGRILEAVYSCQT